MLVLGHRGASVAASENTPEAFALADAMGADGVELDVRRTSGGRLLVTHDPFDESGVGFVEFAASLPTLDQALDACGDRMLVNVEIKNSPNDAGFDPTMAMIGPIIATLRRRGGAARDRWLISSFSWDTLAACRLAAPDIATARLANRVTPEQIARIAAAGHAAVHPLEQYVTADFVEQCHHAGLAVNTWTCNDPQRLVELATMGVDGVCTDVPDVALAALGETAAVSPSWATWPRSGH